MTLMTTFHENYLYIWHDKQPQLSLMTILMILLMTQSVITISDGLNTK